MAVAKTTTVGVHPQAPGAQAVPRERVIVPRPTVCQCCGGGRLRKLGETVTDRGDFRPESIGVTEC